MGDLAMAKATAAHAGLTEVRYTVEVRVGGLADTIAAFAKEVKATSILIGRPRGQRPTPRLPAAEPSSSRTSCAQTPVSPSWW